VVIVMTGYASFDSALAVVRMGAHEYLKKPFDLAEVQRALSSGLSSQESRPVPPELEGSLAVEYQAGADESAGGAEATAARVARMASLCWDAATRDLNAAGLADAVERALRGAGTGARVAIDSRRLRVCPAGTDEPLYAFERPTPSAPAD
jgi:DNA-binding response OmpR family regulator